MSDYTRRFDLPADDTLDIREILSQVYNSLQQKGYNPINQIVGYILSEDPTYITNFNNARTLIRKLDRDELLQETRVVPKRTALFDCPGEIVRRVFPCCGRLFHALTSVGTPRRFPSLTALLTS